jgi:hypothetical protein
VRAEASVAALALDAIRRPLAEAAAILPVLVLLWPPLRRSEVSVFGGRGGMRPMMGQDERSDWYSAAGAWIPPASVVDRLVAAAHARLSPG